MGEIMWRRQVLGLLFLGAAVGWAERWNLQRSGVARSEAAPWYGLEQGGVLTWEADPDAARRAARGCRGEAAVAPGEVLVVGPAPGGCRVWRRLAPAVQRLRLGLALPVNEESLDGLQAVPGIGPKTAEAIVASRPFQRLEELERVRGIGPARRQALSRYLTVLALPRPAGARPPGASTPRTP